MFVFFNNYSGKRATGVSLLGANGEIKLVLPALKTKFEVYTEVARRTGGRLARVPSARALQELLPALVTRRISGVFAHNRQSGVWSDDLLLPDGRILEGEIPLVPGANDIELRIASDGGSAGLFRFRVYSAPGAARLKPIGLGAALPR